MVFVHPVSRISTVQFQRRRSHFPSFARTRLSAVRSNLPFPKEKAKYYRELQAAVDVVERACRLCVDVKRTLLSSDGRILEKTDNTPVTVADFGVQALVSLELYKLFPSIPLVAEEDSSFLRQNNLVDSVVSAVAEKAISSSEPLTHSTVLEAIDRGGKTAIFYGTKPATYWVLDPIDGTRGFLKGNDSLYVVGLALVVEGEIVLGAMGCPNWKDDVCYESTPKSQSYRNAPSNLGIVMAAHVGCGTWAKSLPNILDTSAKMHDGWTRCVVDGCDLVPKAHFCIPDSQTWEIMPLSSLFIATNNPESIDDKKILLLCACCGSLCKYLMVASGRASVFMQKTISQKIIKAWDHAVGMICVHEAGGKVTDWKGDQLDLAADEVERRILFPLDEKTSAVALVGLAHGSDGLCILVGGSQICL